MALNMEMCVTPNHFKASQFEQFGRLSVREEFDLIAPVAIYFMADLKYKKQARAALNRLKKLDHPLVEDRSVANILESTHTPDGLANRYNALTMALVDEIAPEAQARIDTYGAFGFQIGADTNVLMGDAAGMFAYCLEASLVTRRVELSLEEA